MQDLELQAINLKVFRQVKLNMKERGSIIARNINGIFDKEYFISTIAYTCPCYLYLLLLVIIANYNINNSFLTGSFYIRLSVTKFFVVVVKFCFNTKVMTVDLNIHTNMILDSDYHK